MQPRDFIEVECVAHPTQELINADLCWTFLSTLSLVRCSMFGGCCRVNWRNRADLLLELKNFHYTSNKLSMKELILVNMNKYKYYILNYRVKNWKSTRKRMQRTGFRQECRCRDVPSSRIETTVRFGHRLGTVRMELCRAKVKWSAKFSEEKILFSWVLYVSVRTLWFTHPLWFTEISVLTSISIWTKFLSNVKCCFCFRLPACPPRLP